MGIVAVPFSFTSGTTAVASQVNSNFTTLYNEFNGNIDDNNIKAGANINGSKLLASSITTAKLADTSITEAKMDYTSVKVMRTGIAGRKFACGGKAFTLVAGTITVTVTFATDSDDGNPAFGVTPRLVLGIQTTGANTYTARISAISNLSATVVLNSNSGADVSSGTLHWHASAAS